MNDSNTWKRMRIWDRYIYLDILKGETFANGWSQGLDEGEKMGKSEAIRNILLTQKFTISEIARLVNVPEDFVREVKSYYDN